MIFNSRSYKLFSAQEILNVLAPDQRNDGRVRNLAGALEKQIYEKSTSKVEFS
jgi:hypothetical protein